LTDSGGRPNAFDEDVRVAVLGIGNLIYSDDGAGVAALHRLAQDARLPPGVRLVDGSLSGLDTAARIGRTSRLLILDAVDVGAAPGTVVRMTAEELAGLPASPEVHRLGLADLLSVLRLTDRMPAEVVLLGIQPASIAIGTFLSPTAERGVEGLVAESLGLLSRWCGET
jgi:hydrogenase maturation protease